MTTLFSFIVVLGILITVHELGHFLLAKGLGVGVERFSIGFPPRMFSFKRGETEYCVSWIPLGGYVKLKGEGPDEPADPSDQSLFSSRSPFQRAGVISAGPVMNLLLAFLLMPLVFMVGKSIPTFMVEPVRVGWVLQDSLSEEAGVRKGDVLTVYDEGTVGSWEDLYRAITLTPGGDVPLTFERDGEPYSVSIDGGRLKEEGGLGILPQLEPVIGTIADGFPAEEAGLEPGDRILSVGGVPVEHWYALASIIHASAGKEVTLEVDRDGEFVRTGVTPRLDEASGRGLIGISPKSENIIRKYPFIEGIARGLKRNVELLGLTFGFVWDLLTFKASIKMVGGPIMIFQVTGQAARAGLSEFIEFMAFLSLQLGVLNLLPIPVLDGGHLLFLSAEGMMGKPLEQRYRETAQKIGFALLFVLIIVISYNDILRLLGGR